MPEIIVNYLAILVGAIVNMAIGFIWYGPLFGKKWMELSKMDEKKMKQMGGANPMQAYVVAFIGALLLVGVFAHTFVFVHAFFNGERLMDALQTAFWIWLGFIVPVGLNSVVFDSKPFKLFLLHTGYYLVTLLAVGAVIAMMP